MRPDAAFVDLPIRLHPMVADAVDDAAALAGVPVDRFVSDALLAYAANPATRFDTGLAVGVVRSFGVTASARDALMSIKDSPGMMASAREAVRRAVVATLSVAAGIDGSLAA